MFAMEEACSFWSRKVAWRCFLAAVFAVLTIAQVNHRSNLGEHRAAVERGSPTHAVVILRQKRRSQRASNSPALRAKRSKQSTVPALRRAPELRGPGGSGERRVADSGASDRPHGSGRVPSRGRFQLPQVKLLVGRLADDLATLCSYSTRGIRTCRGMSMRLRERRRVEWRVWSMVLAALCPASLPSAAALPYCAWLSVLPRV